VELLITHLLLRLRMRGAIPPILPCIRVNALNEAQEKFYEYETYGVFAVWLKIPEREADHSHPSTTEVKNACSFNSSSLCIFLAWCIMKHMIFSNKSKCVRSEEGNKKKSWHMIKRISNLIRKFTKP
jgi:hypothetical protein